MARVQDGFPTGGDVKSPPLGGGIREGAGEAKALPAAARHDRPWEDRGRWLGQSTGKGPSPPPAAPALLRPARARKGSGVRRLSVSGLCTSTSLALCTTSGWSWWLARSQQNGGTDRPRLPGARTCDWQPHDRYPRQAWDLPAVAWPGCRTRWVDSRRSPSWPHNRLRGAAGGRPSRHPGRKRHAAPGIPES